MKTAAPLRLFRKWVRWRIHFRHRILGLGVLAVTALSACQVRGEAPPVILWRANADMGRVRSVAFNDDGTLVASAGGYLDETHVMVWRAADGNLVKALTNA